jgi:O-antigen/teichoic acid export membrane protein
VLLLGALIGQAAVADYEIALKLTLPAIFVSNAITSALLPKISNLNSRGESVGADVTDSLAFASLTAIPIFFGALAIPQRLVVIAFGSAYDSAAVLLAGIALVRVIQTQANHLSNVLQGVDRPDVPVRIVTISFGFNIVIGYILVMQIGAIGAVIGSIIASGLRYTILAHQTRTLISGVRLVTQIFIKQVTAGLIMFLTVEGTQSIFLIQTLVDLLLVVGTGAAVYCLILLLISPRILNIVQDITDSILASLVQS